MNELKLYNGITMIDDDLIEEAQDFRPKRKTPAWGKWSAAAACVCVVAAGALVWQQHHGQTAPLTFESASEICYVTPWENLTDGQRYQTLDLDGRQYMRGRGAVSAGNLAGVLGEGELSGRDPISGEEHAITGTVYAIEGISADCAVLAYLDGAPYSYVNADYRPAALGQFIDDLNLTGTLELGAGYYTYYGTGYVGRATIEDFDGRLVRERLLSYTDAPAVANYDLAHFGRTLFSVSVNIPVLGYENIAMWVTEDGYLHTNILETGKAFYVGEDVVAAFMDTVQERYGSLLLFTDWSPDDGGGERSTTAATPAPEVRAAEE